MMLQPGHRNRQRGLNWPFIGAMLGNFAVWVLIFLCWVWFLGAPMPWSGW